MEKVVLLLDGFLDSSCKLCAPGPGPILVPVLERSLRKFGSNILLRPVNTVVLASVP